MNDSNKYTETLTIPIEGMSCAACATRIEKVLNKIPDTNANVSFASESALIQYNPTHVSPERFIHSIEKAGFSVPTQLSQFEITGMTCAACATRLEKVLNRLPLVEASVNYAAEEASVKYPAWISDEDIVKKTKSAGFTAILKSDAIDDSSLKTKQETAKKDKFLFSIAVILSIPFMIQMILMFTSQGHEILAPWLQWLLATPVQFWIGKRFYTGAWHALRSGGANMDVLVALGTSTAYFFSAIVTIFSIDQHVYFEASVMIITLVLMGKLLEFSAKRKTSAAIESLIKLQPKTARLLQDGKIVEIAINQVKLNDVFIVRSGENIPVDGVVISGHSTVNESFLTGESMPVSKNTEDNVFAGSLNQQGQLQCKAISIGKNTQLANIIRLVEQAQGSKAPIQRLADKISAIFVPVVVVISFITFFVSWFFTGEFTYSLISAVAVLVIACPCALGLATPTAIMVGTGRGAQHGILIKSAETLEQAKHINTLIIDKTGTLTEGKPKVIDLINNSDINNNEILQIAASLEQGSEHPIAMAIIDEATKLNINILEIGEFSAHSGEGVSGKINGNNYWLGSPEAATSNDVALDNKLIHELEEKGNTIIVLSTGTQCLAYFSIADKLRNTSSQAIQRLKNMGIDVVMLTGDNERSANAIANQVGIQQYKANVKPQDKAEAVKHLKKNDVVVGMVGDGINDAPALAASDVSFAIGAGSGIAIEAADVTLMNDDLNGVANAVQLSRSTLSKIRQNLFFAFIYNIIGIPLAAFGLLNPVIAGAAMALSSVSVVTNSLFLKRWKPSN